MMKLLFITAVSVWMMVPAAQAAQDYSTIKCLSPQETAEELLNIEASGRQFPDSTCMQQENFPRYKIGIKMAGGGDSPDNRKAVILSGTHPYKINSISKNADGYYTVKFHYELSTGKAIKDQMVFVMYESGELKKFFGCAAVTAAPKTLAIHAACLPKK